MMYRNSEMLGLFITAGEPGSSQLNLINNYLYRGWLTLVDRTLSLEGIDQRHQKQDTQNSSGPAQGPGTGCGGRLMVMI